MSNSGGKDGKKKAEKAEPTEVVEVDRRVRENQNLDFGGILYGFRSCMVAVREGSGSHDISAVTCPYSEVHHFSPTHRFSL
jgi:hypothetical protein